MAKTETAVELPKVKLRHKPVSLNWVWFENLERAIRKHVYTNLPSHFAISSAQHRFIFRKSCLKNLMLVQDEVK